MSEPTQTCPSCGAESPADAQFCRSCGAILVRSGDAPRSAAPPPGSFEDARPASGGPPEPTEDKGKSTAAMVIAAVIILGIALFFYEKRDNSQIPVPGEAPMEAPTVVEAPFEAPTAPASASRLATPAPRDAEPPREDDLARELPPRERAPEREPEAPVVDSGRQFRPGWYRVKFRAPLFQSANETAPIVTYLKPGTRIRVTHVVPGFLGVESTTGKAPGFVSTDDAEPEGSRRR